MTACANCGLLRDNECACSALNTIYCDTNTIRFSLPGKVSVTKMGVFDRALSKMSPVLERLRWYIDPDAARTLAAIVALISVFNAYYLLPGLGVFGLDEVHYYPDFTFKLQAEGRWINFLLHDALRKPALATAALLFISISWLTLFNIARELTQDTRYATIIASVLLVAPPFAQQSLWPATHLPAVVTLLALTLLARNGASHRVIYLLGGVLLFGMLQNYYFMLPLLFLGRFDSANKPVGAVGMQLADHFLFWILGAIAGAILALSAVFLVTGEIGITPAEWRRAMPAQNFQDIVRNIFYVLDKLWIQSLSLFKSGTGNNPGFILGLLLLFALRFRSWRCGLPKIIILLAVGLSFFAFSVPMAPKIATRSLVALSSAMIILLLVSHKPRAGAYWLSVGLLVWMGSNFAFEANAYLNRHKSETEYASQQIVAVMPKHPSNYRALAIFGKVDEKAKDAIWFNRAPWTRSIVMALGFNRYWECRKNVPKECVSLGERMKVSAATPNKKIQFIGVSDNIAVLLFGEAGPRGQSNP